MISFSVFRIWKSSDWLPEKWHAVSGYVNSICWSPCGTCALFTTSTEPRIYSLRFSVQEEVQTAGAAVPVMDLTKTLIDEEVVIGGEVQAMQWDPSGERLVVSFKESNLIALFCTRVSMNRYYGRHLAAILILKLIFLFQCECFTFRIYSRTRQ